MSSKKPDKDHGKKTEKTEKVEKVEAPEKPVDVEKSEEREAVEVVEEPEGLEGPEGPQGEDAPAVLEETVAAEVATEAAEEPEGDAETEPEDAPSGGDPSSTLSFEPEELPLDEMRAMDSLDRDPFEPSDTQAFSASPMGHTAALPVIQGNSSFRPSRRPKENNTATIVVSVVSVIAVIAVAIAAIVTVMGQTSPAPVDSAPTSSMQGDIRDVINGTNKREPGPVFEEPAEEAPQPEPEPEPEAPAEPEKPEEATKDRTEWILPESDLRYYTEAELNLLTDEELYLARNEIYARLGREFKNADLRDYFSSKSWYTPKYAPEDFDRLGPTLNSYERANADAIMALENERGLG